MTTDEQISAIRERHAKYGYGFDPKYDKSDIAALLARIDALTAERTFPIQSERGAAPHPFRIPWSIAELAYSVYSAKYGRDQSLEVLAQRGGFGPAEMDMFLPDWREQCSIVAKLTAELAAANARADGERAKVVKFLNRGAEYALKGDGMFAAMMDDHDRKLIASCNMANADAITRGEHEKGGGDAL